MWKKSGKDSGKGGDSSWKGWKKGGSGGGGGAAAAAAGQCVMKFLAPEVLASAIIGKGGSVIAEMRKTCSAKLGLTEHGEFYPSTDCRVLTASANDEESLTELSKQIVAKLVELAKDGSAWDAVGSEEELKLRALVPRAAVGGIIGKGGEAVKKLRETTSAKISFSEPYGTGPGAEQTVSLAGSAEALETVLKEVNTQIQWLNGESWFSTWASSAGTMTSGGYGMQLGPMSYGGGKGRSPQGFDTMMHVAETLPSYVMEDSRGFALSCVVPERLMGGLIGRGGAGTKEVQMITATKISIREIPGDKENRSMNIAGPLANTCAAYMLMMKRYLDAEAAASGSAAG